MKLSTPSNPIPLLTMLVSGFGLGLIIGSIWGQTETTKIVVGFSLIVSAFLIMIYSEIGPL